jgi:hypothetical protein
MKFSSAALALILFASATILHATGVATDGELIKLCIAETLSRDGQDNSGGSPKLVSSNVTRAPEQQIVNVQVSVAEGRLLSGRCVVRDGKIFDFKG